LKWEYESQKKYSITYENSIIIKLVVPLTKDLNNFLATLRKSAGGNTELYLGE